jgi:DNA-directed RNA polymerase specialized sigma24 family protein
MDRQDRSPGTDVDPARLEPNEGYNGGSGELIVGWLGDPELAAEREHLRRLVADEELLLEQQLHGFDGRAWDKFAQEMARYGVAIMSSWIRRGVIYGRVNALTHFGLGRLEGWPDSETSDDLSADTVVDALDYFREQVLRPGRWQSSRGASLGTFFIGQCLYRFANLYRSALRAEITRREGEYVTGELPPETFDPIKGIEHAVIAKHDLADALTQVSTERARKALFLHTAGHTYQEIAEQLGLQNVKQVENMIGYQRSQLRQRRTS